MWGQTKERRTCQMKVALSVDSVRVNPSCLFAVLVLVVVSLVFSACGSLLRRAGAWQSASTLPSNEREGASHLET